MSNYLLLPVATVMLLCLVALSNCASLEREEMERQAGNWNRDERAAPRAAIGDIMYRFHKRTPKYGIGMGSRFGGAAGKRFPVRITMISSILIIILIMIHDYCYTDLSSNTRKIDEPFINSIKMLFCSTLVRCTSLNCFHSVISTN